MANEAEVSIENSSVNVESDPWAAAFEALGKESEESTAPVADAGDSGNVDAPANPASGDTQVPDNPSSGHDNGNEVSSGNLDTAAASAPEEERGAEAGLFGVSDKFIEQYRTESAERIRNQAIDEIAKEFIKRGVRNKNGVLGASIDDQDVCKRDEDGVPRFYNPDTGREFSGDNPRRQAQEWVDDYNKELARAFNNACEKYEEHLKKEEAPTLAAYEFSAKYNKLDDIRRGMLDNVLQDYEVKKDGKVVGYSCDLDKALALVDRQIAMIQNYAKSHQKPAEQTQPKATGPALDMKTSSGAMASGDLPAPTSLAEAMERQQDALLAKLRKK